MNVFSKFGSRRLIWHSGTWNSIEKKTTALPWFFDPQSIMAATRTAAPCWIAKDHGNEVGKSAFFPRPQGCLELKGSRALKKKRKGLTAPSPHFRRAFLKSSETFLASHAVVFRGVVLSSSPQAGVSGEEDNTTPQKKRLRGKLKLFGSISSVLFLPLYFTV